MRNTFGARHESDFGFGAEFDPEFAKHADSSDQFAVVSFATGEVVAASPLTGSFHGDARMDVVRFPSDFDILAAVNMRRAKDADLPPLSQNTHYLTSVADYSERTRILALDGERLALDDDDLLEWLVNAEKQMLAGTDSHPVFETSLEDTSCAIRRLPNGQVSMTEVPRVQVQAMGARIRSLVGEHPSAHISITIETPLRCAARYFLSSGSIAAEISRPDKRAEVTAFLLITRAGYSFGLWSPAAGLFSEYAFIAPDEVSRGAGRATSGTDEKGPVDDHAARGLEAYIRHAYDQLLLQMSPDKLEHLQLSDYAQVVWASERTLADATGRIAAEYAAKSGLEFFHLNAPVDEAVASGLLLGSYSFGEGTVIGAEKLAPVNLGRDILALANTEEVGRLRDEEARIQSRRSRAVMTMMAAPVIVIAVLLALTADLMRSQLMTAWRESRADAKTEELKPALERRKSYEANLKWYQEFISEVSQLRRQQPVGIGLLYQLNSNYPFNIDPSFYVSDMKLSATGDVEMKGLARNKDSVTSFLKALEFAGGAESGSRLFSNLAYEVQEVAPAAPASGQVKLPTMTGSTLTTNNTAAPGVIQWSMKGNYVPVAEFAPKPAAKPPVNPVPAQPAATPKPAA